MNLDKYFSNKYIDCEFDLNILKNNKKKTLLIIDLQNNKRLLKNNIVKDIIYNGRHYNMTCILLTNNNIKIPYNFSCMFSYVVLFNLTNKKYYNDYFCDIFETFEQFNKCANLIFDKKYGIVYDKTTYGYKINEKIFYI